MSFIRRNLTVLLLLSLPLCLFGEDTLPIYSSASLHQIAQNRIKKEGRVIDETGEPLPGTNIVEEGTTHGVVTDLNGHFTIEVAEGADIRISFVGYQTQTFTVTDGEQLLISMLPDELMLDNVVVTALGLKRQESSLTYSMKEVRGDELTRVKDPNLLNALTGKVAGLRINKASSGLGASSKVLLRGIRSAAGDNQPLFVIDGIPVLNTSNEQASTAVGGTADSGNRDGGDGISNLNPDDIESISILKGAPAAALYGSQAANGVILITTKKGEADMRKITFSTNLTFDTAIELPEFQNRYGVSDGVNSWGKRENLTPYDNLKDFYRTGVTSMTSFSISTGNERYQTYFSYGNTTAKGIIDKNRMDKHNINLHQTARLFDNRLKLDGNVTLFRQQLENRTPSGGFYMNPLVGLYRFPRGKDIAEYRDNFEVWNAERNLSVQNWHSDTQDFEQNPYWVINRISSKDVRNRVNASIAAELIVTDWLKIQARGSVDFVSDKVRQQFYASTAPALSGQNGRYVEMDYDETLFYGDVMGLFNKKWGQFSLNAALGASINDKTRNKLRYDSKTASLKYANIFNVANINMNGSAYIQQDIDKQRQLQSLFGTAQLGYKDMFYLDLTARNDWASTLAFTSHEKRGFFYPSIGAAWILHELLRLPSWVSFGKVRATYSKVGNDIPEFITHPMSHIGAGGEIEANDAAPFKEMKPEMTNAIELGTEWKFLENRINLGITYYKTNTKNQFFKLPAQSGDKYAYYYVNAGDIQNSGWEITLSGFPITTNDWTWRSEINFSSNRNKVIKLHEELPVFLYGPKGFSSSYAMMLIEGGSFGDIYGKAFRHDAQGHIVYETTGERAGLPIVDGEGNDILVGNAMPKFNLSWSNAISYKGISLSFLIDGRFGGEILSQTQADMDLFGVTNETADARDAGYVMLEGRKIDKVEMFFRNVVGGRAGVTEYYMYDATNIRLRELAVAFQLPRTWVEKTKVFQNVQFSFVGRNLLFLYKKAPFDPELVLSTGNDNQGIEVYGMPTTRSLGFNIKCDF